MEPREIVQAAIDAYHDHELDRCMDYYAPDVVVKDAEGKILADGADAVRQGYAKAIDENPNIRYEIPNRIALGNWVIDEERVTGFTKPGSPDVMQAVLVYRVLGQQIQEIVILS